MRVTSSPAGFIALMVGVLLLWMKIPFLDIVGALLFFGGLLAPVVEKVLEERKAPKKELVPSIPSRPSTPPERQPAVVPSEALEERPEVFGPTEPAIKLRFFAAELEVPASRVGKQGMHPLKDIKDSVEAMPHPIKEVTKE